MVYHSNLEDAAQSAEIVCGCAILPIKTTTKGPTPVVEDGDDIIDEVLGFFKANVLFKQFQPAGPADRVLVYLTLYTTQALAKCVTCENAPAALKALTAMAHENFKIPGDSGFTLGTFYPSPQSTQEADLCRQYLKQLREELGRRLITKVYLDGSPSKLWLAPPQGLHCRLERRALQDRGPPSAASPSPGLGVEPRPSTSPGEGAAVLLSPSLHSSWSGLSSALQTLPAFRRLPSGSS
eukprot:Transcript_7564.p1 GENE.Transcript_7564~~Transcript_7564.p1  ORF type:complete len:238 (-),score=47.53 Transcript_7564:325-1038(-)